ncbi:hypothetical protein AB0M10_32965 [Streptomyces sp. NPDC051840]|uniref:hypothetical protein n=1 Tax=Streptomyces sp. NPDC051840 TaxID=3154752 RepID=UPI003433A398
MTTPTPAEQLRERIAALFRQPPGGERLGDATPGEIADAVLALLPAPADQATTSAEWSALLNQAADRMKTSWFTDEATAVAAKVEMRRLAAMAAAGVQQPAEGEAETEPLTEEQVIREHVTTVHLIGEQLADVESWLWQRLADARDATPPAAPAATEEPK